MHLKISDLANLLGGKLIGNGETVINGVSGINPGEPNSITFAQEIEVEKIINTKASCVILKSPIDGFDISQIIVDDPFISFIKILEILDNERKIKPKSGISSICTIGNNTNLGNNPSISPYVFIGENTIIGDNAVIYPFVYIGENVTIGSNVVLYSNVSIREGAVIGNNVIIHSGSVIGSDGYGYIQRKGKHVKIPQVGNVIIDDDVEIGACVAIDRAMLDKTHIGKGTKIDNLVHIGHNSEIGENVLLAGQVGLGGSCKIGNYVTLAGQVGIKDHVKVGAGVQVGAQGGVIGNIEPKSVVWGTPARPLKEVLASYVYLKKIPNLISKIEELEKKINCLTENKK